MNSEQTIAAASDGYDPLSKALQALPERLRGELIDSFVGVVRNHREGRWRASVLEAGRLCEVVYSVVRGTADGTFPERACKPRNMTDACRELEQLPSSDLSRSFRIQIPRILISVYELRNNRNVGHVGGDVDPGQMDSHLAVVASRWMVAELIRALHGLTVEEAGEVVSALITRDVPLVWKRNGMRRVLRCGISAGDKTLILLYGEPAPTPVGRLLKWVEYKNPSRFRSHVLAKLHAEKMIEFHEAKDAAEILPPGVTYIESEYLCDGTRFS